MEIGGSVRSYLRILINTSQHTRSFEKYEDRLKSLGIKLPEAIQPKIKAYLYKDDSGTAIKTEPF